MDRLRFALLEHQTSEGVHWDLLIEVRDRERLATWRIYADPRGRSDPVPCERIADHRPLYLDYEGPISGNRGRVRRIDAGTALWIDLHRDQAVFELRGEHLCGRYAIRPGGGGLELSATGGD